MENKEKEQILKFRNRTSILLDDLVSLVRNETLAGDLRVFNDLVMGMVPGIAFGLRQAKQLKELTERVLNQYASNAIRDDDLIRYSTDARMIMKGQSVMNGGNQMSLFDKVFHGKEIKRQEKLNQMRRRYQELCEDILACEKEKERCIRESRGASPDSMTYRNNERAYMAAKNKIILLQKQEDMLRKALDEAEKMEVLRKAAKDSTEISHLTDELLGDEKNVSKDIATWETHKEKMTNAAENLGLMTSDVFAMDETLGTRTDNEFGLMMAEDERRQAAFMSAGVSENDMKQERTEARSEFADLVGSDEKE